MYLRERPKPYWGENDKKTLRYQVAASFKIRMVVLHDVLMMLFEVSSLVICSRLLDMFVLELCTCVFILCHKIEDFMKR